MSKTVSRRGTNDNQTLLTMIQTSPWQYFHPMHLYSTESHDTTLIVYNICVRILYEWEALLYRHWWHDALIDRSSVAQRKVHPHIKVFLGCIRSSEIMLMMLRNQNIRPLHIIQVSLAYKFEEKVRRGYFEEGLFLIFLPSSNDNYTVMTFPSFKIHPVTVNYASGEVVTCV